MKLSTKSGRIVGGIICFIVAVLVCIYFAVAFSYSDRFFPNTIINGENFGKADKTEVLKVLETQLKNYSLTVYGRDLQAGEDVELFRIVANDIDLIALIKSEDVDRLLKQQNHFLWPIYIGQNFEYHIQGDISYDADKFVAFLGNQDSFDETITKLPEDAYIQGYSEEAGEFVLVPEVQGTRLNRELAQEVIEAAIAESVEKISLEEKGCYLEPSVMASDETLQQNLAQANQWLKTEIKYNWNTQEVILSGTQIQEWVSLQNGMLSLDRDAIGEFVKQNAEMYDTYGKSRMFRTTLGYDLALPSGAFGWLTDYEAETEELLKLIESGVVCDREPVYAHKAPWKGMNDIGNSYVEADMTHQHLYLYQNGTLVLETDFVSGDMSKNYNTPEGVFGVTYKTTNAILRGGDYAEHVSYWMPYHGNYGMHDATWREEFGGDIYLTNGSHGCINLPLDKAGEIYQQVSEGFPVICYYYPPGVLPEPDYYDSDDEDD